MNVSVSVLVTLLVFVFVFRYFEDEEEDSSNVDLPYIPAENSPTRQQFHSKPADSDSDDDPLEAFMAEVEASISPSFFLKILSKLK